MFIGTKGPPVLPFRHFASKVSFLWRKKESIMALVVSTRNGRNKELLTGSYSSKEISEKIEERIVKYQNIYV